MKRRAYIKRSSKPIRRTARPRSMRKGKHASLARQCASLWSAAVLRKNEGRCLFEGWDEVPCDHRIDPAHCFGKKAHPSVRYELWNGVPLCRYHHDMYGNGKGWEAFLFQTWGAALYAERYGLACSTRKLDLAEVKRSLEAA